MRRLSPTFISWDICPIKGAVASPQKLKGRVSTALVRIIGAMGPDCNYLNQIMGKKFPGYGKEIEDNVDYI